MSAPSSGAADEARQLQQTFAQHQQELTHQLKQAHECIQAGRASDAYAMLRETWQYEETFYSTWETRLIQAVARFGMDGWWHGQIAQEKARVLWTLGQAATLSGQLEDGQAAFEQALALLGEEPSGDRAMVLDAAANVYRERGRLDEAEGLYRRAVNDYGAVALWAQCCMALSSLADCAYARGDRTAFLQHLEEATELAQTHQLLDLTRDLHLKTLRLRLSTDPTGATLQAVKRERDRLTALSEDIGFQVDVRLLIAEYATERGDLATAEESLQEALDLVEANPAKKWAVLMALERVREAQGRVAEAIQHAEQALGIARTLGLQDHVIQALLLLVPLRITSRVSSQQDQAAREMAEFRDMGRPLDFTQALLSRALSFYQTQQFAPALADIEEAERTAPTLELRQRAVLARAATLQAMNRPEDALAADVESIKLLDRQLASTDERALANWKDLLREHAALHANAAVLTSKLGRVRESFQWAETSKAQVLRWQLEQARLNTVTTEPSSFPTLDEVYGWLADESAAMILFCVGGRETLALVVDPARSEPQPYFIDLTEDELKRLFPTDRMSSEEWNATIFQALALLSGKLAPPLQAVIDRCDVLYLALESALNCIPFAALTFEDGTRLVEHCAIANTPSAAVLRWCRSRLVERRPSTCLAVGVGKEDTYSFAEQAATVAEQAVWRKSETLAEGTAAQFLERMTQHEVVHLLCHGSVERGVLDTLSSSRLQFADRALTAKEVVSLGAPVHAQLVFLNACMSGSFQSELGSEVGGFWQAFLHAGAPSLIATLGYVHPHFAQQLSLEFYREWLKSGTTKAEALRRAQLHMLRKKIEPRHWACHILIGDHR